MGRSIALTLARKGAKVVVNYNTSQASAQAIVDYIRQAGGEAIPVQADIFSQDGCASLVDATVEQHGQVDICIVGPGGGWHPEPPDKVNPGGALEDLHREVAPLLYLMPLVLPGMIERKWGRLVGIAQHPTRVSPAYAYNMAKAARAQALLQTRDRAWTGGVTVNVIAPGPVDKIDSLEGAIEQSAHGAAWHDRQNVSPQDIAEGVAFLCSEAGRFVSGCTLPYLFH